MRLITSTLILLLCATVGYSQIIITGIADGPLSGGTKVIEFYATADVADLSVYGVGFANNGGGTDGQEYTFPMQSVNAGDFFYGVNNAANATAFFGLTDGATLVIEDNDFGGFNGDDAIELYLNGTIIDIFGDINVDGNGQPWEYLDSWAYRVDATGPDGSTFNLANWTFGTVDIFDGETTNASSPEPFPLGTYSTTGASNPTVSFTTNGETVVEGAGTYDLQIQIQSANSVATTVTVVPVASGSTVDVSDVSYSVSPITFPASSDANQVLTITINDDAIQESTETLTLALTSPTNNASLGVDTFTLTILDNDTPLAPIVITEIYYNSPDGPDSLEFLEIFNNGATPVDLGGYSFVEGISHEFAPGTMIMGNGYLVLVKDSVAFFNAFGVSYPEWNSGALTNSGEDLIIVNAQGIGLDTVDYGDNSDPDWPAAADGDGPSLVLCDVNADNNDGSNWQAASTGTGVIIDGTEVFANFGAASGCLAGPLITLATDAITVGEDAGTVVFDVILSGGNGAVSTVDVSLNTALSTATEGSDFVFSSQTVTFDGASAEDTVQVAVTITDDADIEVLETIVLDITGATNASVTIPTTITLSITDNDTPIADVVITEIYYNSPDGPDSLEFIELYNNESTAVDLDGYTFTQGIEHTFQGSFIIPAGGYVVLAKDINAFTNEFGALTVSVGQWQSGALGNGGEDIELRNSAGLVVDYVDYDDGGDWPAEADGQGPSLVLCDVTADNNDAANWQVSTTETIVTIEGTLVLASPGFEDLACDMGMATIEFGDADFTVNEGDGTATVTVNITNGDEVNPTTAIVSIMASSTATLGTDFTVADTILTFPNVAGGDTSVTFTINIVDDVDTEADETIVLMLDEVANPNIAIGTNGSLTITIEDNDNVSTQSILASEVAFYPNPAREQLVVKNGIALDAITVTDVAGRAVQQYYGLPAGRTDLDVSALPQGVYFITFRAGREVYTSRLVVAE